ncbi:hypothetical protein H8959_008406 [Pygathrix nigripes]
MEGQVGLSRVLPTLRFLPAGWLGEEGRWPWRSLGRRLPLSRQPPWEPEDGSGSSGRPRGGGAEARGAERGGRELQQPVVAHQNRNQRQLHGHLSRPFLPIPAGASEGCQQPGPLPLRVSSSPAPASGRRLRPPPREERAGHRLPLGAPGGGPGRAGASLGRPRRLGLAL